MSNSEIKILNGNELIIQGGLEAGFSLYTGYPGSPLADYFNILYAKRNELAGKGIRVAIANSEANAAAMASGAKQANRDVMVAMKSMGLHVASDALSVGNFANPGKSEMVDGKEMFPGVVVAVGDDPWSISTSTPADSRYLYKHLHIPFLEPSTPQELKDWVKHALYISKRTSVYQGLLLTTYMAEGGGRVEVYDEAVVDGTKTILDPKEFDLSKNVMVPPNSLKADVSMIKERFPRVYDVYKELNLDKKFGNDDSKIGVISSGVIFETLKQVMEEGGYLDSLSLYKLASSFPLVDDILVPYLSKLETLIVVEEKRGFLETELKELITRHNLKLKVYGKKFDDQEGFVSYGGLSYEIIVNKFDELFKILKLNPCQDLKHTLVNWGEVLPRRLPTFCPGCPHRETLSLLKDLRKRLEKEGVNLISHGDVGCYSLSFLPPFKEMHNLSAMGQGGALGAGVDLFTDNPSVVLMGDSTFFHSGLTDISNSVQLDHNITYILLDNDNTAMTGHQMTPASGVSVEGTKRPRQSMLTTAKALGVTEAIEVNPSDRYFYQNVLMEFINKRGVKVIVSNKECALTFHGREKARDRKIFGKGETQSERTFYQINTLACEDCRVCVEETGCPGLTQTFDAYGTKVAIDPQICVADSYCTKIKACPSFEKVTVFNYHPNMYQEAAKEINTDLPLPEIKKSFDDIAAGSDFRVVVTGVGGSGVTTISKVLSHAALKMSGRDDLDFKFVDQKGLAQRNGNVTGHLAIYQKGKSYGAVTPRGTADLHLSPDLLDGAQHISFLSNDGKAILDKKFQVPLSIILNYGEEGEPINQKELLSKLENSLGDKLATFPMKDLCYEIFGKNVYASAMILGVAFQKGLLPFSFEDMKEAFSSAIRKDEYKNNLKAFTIGRKLEYLGVEKVLASYMSGHKKENPVKTYIESIKESILPWQNTKYLVTLFNRDLERLSKYYPDFPIEHLARYLHDIYIYNRGLESSEFITNAATIKELYKDIDQQKIALRTLARTYFVKDEVFVSHIMISPMKRITDESYYSKIGTGFSIEHINRPAFDIFGKKIEFDINPRPWMLRLMRHFRILRLLLPSWHKLEREIANTIREEILTKIYKMDNPYKRLKELENIKGYREVRYEKANLKLHTPIHEADPSKPHSIEVL